MLHSVQEPSYILNCLLCYSAISYSFTNFNFLYMCVCVFVIAPEYIVHVQYKSKSTYHSVSPAMHTCYVNSLLTSYVDNVVYLEQIVQQPFFHIPI